MTHAGHFVEKCHSCNRIITQCRCMEPLKEIRWSLCPNCAGLSGHMIYQEQQETMVTAAELKALRAENERLKAELALLKAIEKGLQMFAEQDAKEIKALEALVKDLKEQNNVTSN